jgi:hypothetical protein
MTTACFEPMTSAGCPFAALFQQVRAVFGGLVAA